MKVDRSYHIVDSHCEYKMLLLGDRYIKILSCIEFSEFISCRKYKYNRLLVYEKLKLTRV